MTRPSYPFSAIVGQSAMKRALILAAIHPGLGGVLIRGEKGAAKSTAVRALASLLPEVEVYEGDPFSRAPEESVEGWPLDEGAKLRSRPAALVNLPVGATEDRVVGSLDFESALTTGRRRFEPGLLASAHRGILYVDEVNLLPDHLVDVLLDASAMGENSVEREGVAFRHPARFVLIGTMNPEEGDLRPQLLDRFGLCVDTEPLADPADRAEAVRRRLAFEGDPVTFTRRWDDSEHDARERIRRAKRLLPSVVMPESVLESLCRLCAREGAEGLRADLSIHRAASSLAAYEGRGEVTANDVEAVAEMALTHRRTTTPDRPPPVPPVLDDPVRHGAPSPGRSSPTPGPERPPESRSRAETGKEQGIGIDADGEADPATPCFDPFRTDRPSFGLRPPRRASASGRRGRGAVEAMTGVVIGSRPIRSKLRDPSILATLIAAAPRQIERGRGDGPIRLRLEDLRERVRERSPGRLVLFAVDSSRSMGARERISATKAAVLSLLVSSYQKRDRVALIGFGLGGVRLLVPPTRSVRAASKGLEGLRVGGATPLAAGLELVFSLLETERHRDPGVVPLVVLLTDGRGNLPLAIGGDPVAEGIGQARRLGRAKVAGLVIDTEGGPARLGLARRLADAWGADYRSIATLSGPRLPDAVRRAVLGLAS